MTKTILIVDDNEHLRHTLGMILRSCDYEILEAASGTQAIEKLVAVKPDLIILDLELPDKSGVGVALAIKKNSATADIPILGCSAHSETEMREVALRAGMIDYLQKPVRAVEFRAKIQKLIPTGK